MPSNVEIKARIPSVAATLARALAIADGPPQLIRQDDTFFTVPHGRLKLRVFGCGSGELIHYLRPDHEGPKRSDYVVVPVASPDALRQALAGACGLLGRVRKHRTLLLAGQTRIHLDEVEGLGSFAELEVVLHAGQTEVQGQAIALALMSDLGLDAQALVGGAYLDLLMAQA